MMVFGKLCRKGWCSSTHRTKKCSDNGGSRIITNGEFDKVGPETAKIRCPYLVVLGRGPTKSPIAMHYRGLLVTKVYP